jgi:hypothetical protein
MKYFTFRSAFLGMMPTGSSAWASERQAARAAQRISGRRKKLDDPDRRELAEAVI